MLSIAVGSRRVLCSQQFHVKYCEGFSLTFSNNEEEITIRFVQKIEEPKPRLLPFSNFNPSAPHLKVAEEQESEDLCYELVNFNQTKITTQPIPFYSKQPSGHYYFQLSAMSISSELNDPETIWLYTATIYEDKNEEKDR